jgi:Chaperone of endosialidase
MLGRFNTDFAQQSAAQDAQLAARGMSPGSQGYSDVQQGRDRARTDATQQAYLASGQESRAAQEAYNQATQQRYELGANYADRGNQLRQAQMEEAFAMRNQPINEIMALLGGSQVNMPNFSPYSRQGISASSPGGYQQQNYQNKLQQTAATNEGLFGLGKAALTGYFSSDRRLKEDILPLGMTLAGAPLYRFRYRGQPELQIGVMADEVRPLHPDAVITNPDGFDMVNYGLLAERAGGFSNG